METIFVKGCDAESFIAAQGFAVLPLGSVEYHGPHAQLGTDTILARYFADWLSGAYSCVVYPVAAFSPLPGKTAHFPGSISLRPEIYLGYLSDILSGICRSGQKNILILNAHDGNIGPARTAAEYVSGLFADVNILIVNWWQLTDEKWSKENCGLTGGGRGHGGAYEISAAAFAAGDKNDTDNGAKTLLPVKVDSTIPHTHIQSRPQNWEGYIGYPQEISSECGGKILAACTENLRALIDAWLKP